MVFKPHNFKLYCPEVSLCGHKFEYNNMVKYLGVYLQDNMSDDKDIQRQIRSLYSRANSLLRKFAKCSADVKKSLFISYCSTMYCSHLWVNRSNVMYHKIRVAYNNVFRRLLGYSKRDSASHMFVSNHIDNFETLYRKNVYNFMQRLTCVNNLIVSTLVHLDQNRDMIWNKWVHCIYTVHVM